MNQSQTCKRSNITHGSVLQNEGKCEQEKKIEVIFVHLSNKFEATNCNVYLHLQLLWWIATKKSAHWTIFIVNEWVTNSKLNRLTVKPTYVGSMCMVARRRRWRRRNSLNGSDGCGWKILRNSALVTCQKEEIQWPRSSAVLSLRLLLFFPHFLL